MIKKLHYMFQLDIRVNVHTTVSNSCDKVKITSITVFPILYKTSQTSHLIKTCLEPHATK